MRIKIFFIFIFSFSICSAQKKPIGVTWGVVEINGRSISLDSSELPVFKLENGRINGHTSCNRLLGEYTLKNKNISFFNVGGTKMLCQEPFRNVELNFLEAVKNVKTWKIKKKKLYLYDKNKNCIIILNRKE